MVPVFLVLVSCRLNVYLEVRYFTVSLRFVSLCLCNKSLVRCQCVLKIKVLSPVSKRILPYCLGRVAHEAIDVKKGRIYVVF